MRDARRTLPAALGPRRRFPPALAPLLVALAAAATGPACQDEDDDSGAAATAADCAPLGSALCDAIARCAEPWVTLAYGDRATCAARFRLACEGTVGSSAQDTTRGEVRACASALSAASCADLLGNNVVACRFTGKLANGARCGSDGDCQSAFCKGGGPCGTCAPRQDAGGTCTKNEECKPGLVCPESGNPRRCVAPAAASAACAADRPCIHGHTCQGGTCQPARTLNAACMPDDGTCDGTQALYCHPLQRTCQRLGLAGAGEPCGIVDGGYTVCRAGGQCQTPLVGVCLAPAGDGEPCGGAAGGRPCLAPATCESGLCRLPGGASCAQ